jgi:hypothetical protein
LGANQLAFNLLGNEPLDTNHLNNCNNMKKTFLFAFVSMALCAGSRAAELDFPTSTVLGTQVINISAGPTFTVSGNYTASDTIDATVSGTVDLDSGDYTANAAGVLVAPPTSNTGSHPGQVTISEGFPYAALLIGNSTLGFFPLFPADVADGLGDSTPPTNLSVDETLGSIFGPTVTIGNGTVLEFEVNDIDNFNNSGAFTVSSGVPDAGATVALLGLSLCGLGTLRRRLA